MGGFSIWHWLVVLVIVVLVFGTKRLKNVGKDLGEAVKGFKKGVQDDDADPPAQLPDESRSNEAANDADAAPRHDTTPRDDDRNPR